MLTVHFLNVGKGNCTIIDFPSTRLSMIDIDNSRIEDDEEVLTDPVQYFKNNFPQKGLFRFILTHPDMDHLSGLNELSKTTAISNFWDTDHNKTFSDKDWEKSPYDKKDWDKYQAFRKSTSDPKSLLLYQDATAECCWIQDGLTLLSPTAELVKLANETEEYNHLSYVLMLNYKGTKICFGGDASVEAWESINTRYDAAVLKSSIFIAPHHGSSNNIHDKAFKKIAPAHVIVSVAEGVDYDYDYYSKLAGKLVLSTKYYGTMKVQIKDDGTYLPITVEKNAN